MNTFAEGNEILYCISSGTPVPSEIENDIMNAELFGAEARETFVSERLSNEGDFFSNLLREINSSLWLQSLNSKGKICKAEKGGRVQTTQQCCITAFLPCTK